MRMGDERKFSVFLRLLMRIRALLVPLLLLAFAPVAQAELSSSDFTTVQLPGSDNHTEPRIAVDQNDNLLGGDQRLEL